MTPNDAPSTIPCDPDYISGLMQLPAFQNLLAKVETNFYRNRPNVPGERPEASERRNRKRQRDSRMDAAEGC